jgi:hypothetical protein
MKVEENYRSRASEADFRNSAAMVDSAASAAPMRHWLNVQRGVQTAGVIGDWDHPTPGTRQAQVARD